MRVTLWNPPTMIGPLEEVTVKTWLTQDGQHLESWAAVSVFTRTVPSLSFSPPWSTQKAIATDGLLNLPESLLLQYGSSGPAAVRELADKASKRASPWEATSIEVDGELVPFLRLRYDEGSILVSRADSVLVSLHVRHVVSEAIRLVDARDLADRHA